MKKAVAEFEIDPKIRWDVKGFYRDLEYKFERRYLKMGVKFSAKRIQKRCRVNKKVRLSGIRRG
ncbi:MAG TPA: hypothetical protein VKO43_06530 [Candidatus Krumholzibacteriaceae bacterium]|nr:hypothetical protein [Candidatus Krumholzibacteriaceae bacterium]